MVNKVFFVSERAEQQSDFQFSDDLTEGYDDMDGLLRDLLDDPTISDSLVPTGGEVRLEEPDLTGATNGELQI